MVLGIRVPILAAAFVLAIAAVHAQAQDGGTASAPITEGLQIDGTYGNWLPPDVSKHGYHVDRLINFLHLFMGVLFVGWGAFFVYCLVRFRARPGRGADSAPVKAKPAKYSEIAVAAIEAVLLLGFSVPIWASVRDTMPSESENPLHVRVVAEQFQWNFHYPGPDGEFGRTRPELVNTATNPLGLDSSDRFAEDDIYATELHFPKDRPVIAHITSKDVIHSFFLPVMRVKQDAIPGMRIPVWFEAKEAGTFEVACAQLCGNNHYSMKAVMTIHPTEDEFASWLESQKPEEFDEDAFD